MHHEQNLTTSSSHYGAVTVAAPFTVASGCLSSYFLMEIVFVRSHVHGEARRGGVETGALRFISGPQSVFCLASWCAAWTCRLQVPAYPPPGGHHHSWSTATSYCNWPALLSWAYSRYGMVPSETWTFEYIENLSSKVRTLSCNLVQCSVNLMPQ